MGDSPDKMQLSARLRHIESLSTTYGSWRTESEAEDYLLGFVQRTGLFRVYRQAGGTPHTQPHFRDHTAGSTSLRADLILVPRRELVLYAT